ncbi:endonuclease NucS (plasmid) [Halococcus dombrowskii]|uniref:Endonuclease NucS n=1 Tax=Halococcus dombrowskii TaxID=179637 RepID=A0AAV3SJ46_HALDO|nr:endonuclease NucS [Halococcus dombrowskii]UOO97538.1 endonuclease NucS [Halococcus dombrowskii]
MPVSTLTDPTLKDAHYLVDTGLKHGEMLTIVGKCEVDYDGRASSHLASGERLVILKPDGTLLVHRNKQRKPVNWQPPGSTHSARLNDDHLIVESVRSSPHEELEITFQTVAQASRLELDDMSEFALEGSEEDLRQRILADPDILETGFNAMATERETSAGPIDIYGQDADGTPIAVELKRRRVGPDAVGQLNRYVEALERNRPGKSVRGILVAPSVTERAKQLLTSEGLEFVSLTPEQEDISQPTDFSNDAGK